MVFQQIQTSWGIGGKVSRPITTSWNTNTVSKQIMTGWSVGNDISQVTGQRPALFYAKHTGEVNSNQVIRFRNAKNPNQIVFESVAESNTKGSITVTIDWTDPSTQDTLQVSQQIYSDMNFSLKQWKIIRPLVYLLPNNFPVYVTHEYASTTEWKYMIRYLGFISQNPYRNINGPQRSYNIDDQAKQYGLGLLHTNFTGLTLNVKIKTTDGRVVTGLLPPNAAIAVLKVDDLTRKIGYITQEGLTKIPGAGVAFATEAYSPYFKSFS